MAKLNLKDLSWVLRGKQRRTIIKSMNGTKIPTQISKDSGLSLNHTSRVLRQFEKKGLVKCLTPREKVGRLYKLTARGESVRREMFKGSKDC